MFPFSKQLMQTLDIYSKQQHQSPVCTKCKNTSIWMDWGPIVGKGYYCKTCKDDVEHDDNVYGSIASAKRKLESTKRPFSTDDDYEYINLNCTKPNCSNCNNTTIAAQHVPVRINSFVRCVNNNKVNKSLQINSRYRVTAVGPGFITILIGSMHKEYTRCRFQLEIPKVKTA